jgi:hypothetical protein
LTKSGSSYLVSGTAFVQYYGIPAQTSVRYAAFKDGDILCMDLNGEGTEVSSARGRTPGDTEFDGEQEQEVRDDERDVAQRDAGLG